MVRAVLVTGSAAGRPCPRLCAPLCVVRTGPGPSHGSATRELKNMGMERVSQMAWSTLLAWCVNCESHAVTRVYVVSHSRGAGRSGSRPDGARVTSKVKRWPYDA